MVKWDSRFSGRTTIIHHGRRRVHIKPIPGYAPTPPTAKASSERREEGASVPVEMPDTNVTVSPPKPRLETPIKQKPDNPPDSFRTSRPRRIIKAPVKYGYE